MRCVRCKNKVEPGPERCPHCDGPLELGFGDVARWTLIGVIRRLRSGGLPALSVVAVAVGIVAVGVFGVRALSGGGDEPVSTIAQMRPAAVPAATSVTTVTAPTGEVEPWMQVLGGTDSEIATGTASSASGEIVFVGRSQSRDFASLSDALFVRTDESGIVLSRAVIGGLGQSGASDVAIGRDGAIYAVGRDGPSLNLVRLDERGEMLWGAALPASEGRAEPVVTAISNTGLLAASIAEAPDTVMLVRIDEAGHELWQRDIAAVGLTGRIAVANAPAGGIYLSINASETGIELAVPILIRLDENGDELWRHAFEERVLGQIDDLASTLDGALYVSGQMSVAAGASQSTPWLGRVSSDGVVDWEADLFADPVYGPVLIDASAAHGVHLMAAAPSAVSTGRDIWLSRIDRQGDLLWTNLLESAESKAPTDLIVAPDGDLIISGGVAPAIGASSDILMLRVAEGGVPPLGLKMVEPPQVDFGPVEQVAATVPAPLPAEGPAPVIDATFSEPDASEPELAPNPVSRSVPPESFDGAGETVEGLDAEEAPIPATFACAFRCRTTGDEAVRYPVTQTYSRRGIADPQLFALEVQSEGALVCQESGGVLEAKLPPSCQ
ncbi:MAG: hypothetical protein AAFW65_07535 [Pseudomonadota bacterium]